MFWLILTALILLVIFRVIPLRFAFFGLGCLALADRHVARSRSRSNGGW